MGEPPYGFIEPNVGFRILVLHHATAFDDELKCSLTPATLADHAQYEALSYVWGNQREQQPVTLGNLQIQVTVNLERALRHLRLPDRDRNLWVDALCINQSDIQERNSHVQYMKDVYANCTSDIFWLGENASIIVEGLNAMQEFGSLMELDWKLKRFKGVRELFEREKQQALRDLFAIPPIWKRVWIMQEVAYAPRVQLVAGNASIPWETVEAFLDIDNYIKRYGMPDAYPDRFHHETSVRVLFKNAFAYPQILAIQRRVIQNEGSYQGYDTRLFDVLARFRYTSATDARDKIFALLGFVDHPSRVQVDYSHTLNEVYIQVASKLIEIDGNLDLICLGPWHLYGNKNRIANLPSWVPDFSHPGCLKNLFAPRNMFNAFSSGTEFRFSVSTSGNLIVRGHTLDDITTVRRAYTEIIPSTHKAGYHPPYPPLTRLALIWMPKVHVGEGVRQGNSSLASYPSLEDSETPLERQRQRIQPFEAYWRTLMMDYLPRPLRRVDTEKDLDGLQNIFSTFLLAPLDKKRSIDMDFEVQKLVLPASIELVFAISKEGHYCMVPAGTQPGDQIVILRGARTPVLIRPSKDRKDNFEWIGSCYVHGFMDGQILQHIAPGQQEATFNIA